MPLLFLPQLRRLVVLFAALAAAPAGAIPAVAENAAPDAIAVPPPFSPSRESDAERQQIEEMRRHPKVVVGTVVQLVGSDLEVALTSMADPNDAAAAQTREVAVGTTPQTVYVQQVPRDQKEFMQDMQAFNRSMQMRKKPYNPAADGAMNFPEPYTEQPLTPDAIAVGARIEAMGTWQGEIFTASKISKSISFAGAETAP